MAIIYSFPGSGALPTISQAELEELEQAMYLKVLADGHYMTLNSRIMAKLDAGAVIEPGDRIYHRNTGVKEAGQSS